MRYLEILGGKSHTKYVNEEPHHHCFTSDLCKRCYLRAGFLILAGTLARGRRISQERTFHSPQTSTKESSPRTEELFQTHYSLRWQDKSSGLSLGSPFSRYSHLVSRAFQGLLIQKARRQTCVVLQLHRQTKQERKKNTVW